MVGVIVLPRKYCPSSTTKGFSTTTLMRIMALLSGRMDDPLHINREKIRVSQVLIDILGFKGRVKFGWSPHHKALNRNTVRTRIIKPCARTLELLLLVL